ncbi:MAG TPA: choice-of-anchor D domain-containing protein [Candidatus Limnocylindrales bacterium]|nr:choice-of-anchor D domain-containing protein [Candidatus Limnocylindrales bacterium]
MVSLSGTGFTPGTLAISPSAINFGNVTIGSSASQTASLTATGSNVTVSSAGWNGLGYTVSGITFPVTVLTGQSVPFTVTFTPQTASLSSGSISFVSDAANSPTSATLSGTGVQPPQHSASLSWTASTSTVAGYNVYRGSQSGGPYTLITLSPQPGTTYTDNSVQAGITYFYVVTAVDSSAQESVFSNEVVAAIPTP